MRRNMNQMPGRGGPLMTDHLQDLELELELLKRKRQLIQRQQSSMLYDRPSAPLLDNMRYNQPSQSFNDRFNEPQHLNFSHLYNDTPRNNQGFGLKRQAQPDWPGAPSNNMGGQKRPRPNPFIQPFQNNTQQPFQRPGFMPQPLLNTPKPKPLMNLNFPVQRNRPGNRPNMKQNQGPKPLTHHPNFRQNKPANANRPGNANRPDNASRPAGFVAKKNASPKKPIQNNSSNTPSKKAQDRVFTANKKPNNKMNGRLELALGMIVKEIRVTYENKPEYKGLFSYLPLTRLMKQGVRERLHSAMDGKKVDKTPDILAEYRQKFPLETDKEIVELAVLEQKKSDQKIELAITLLEEGDPEQFFKKNMNKLLQARFDEMMGKLEKIITEENKLTTAEILENLPAITKEPGNANTKHTPKANENESEKAEETPADAETAEKAAEAPASAETAEKAPEAPASAETAEKPAETAPEADETPKPDEPVKENGSDLHQKEDMYQKWLSFYIQRRLPALVHRHRSNILKVFDLDHMYSNTKAAIIINANNKAQAMKAGQKNDSEQGKDDPELPRNLPYFAKVLAIPAMPKRKIMQEFLNKFQPKTIKRHKKNYNLLFVGFDSKDNYDKILAANQTTVGNATLSILGNVTKASNESDDLDQVLTPQLDDQINDLLSSIRKADEESNANGDNSVADVDLTQDETHEVQDTSNETPKVEEAVISETDKGNENVAANETDNKSDDCEVVETNGSVVTIEDDEVAPLKTDEAKKPAAPSAPATPAKGKAPATPRSVNTRRSSRLQN
ncbi:serine-aspartate repeat-containing protein I-like [Cydia fagiglandana]|uniref:serine-aspartate repeat-containing protein I-like n=1 Tax=Cydia fagiglandana TaxID=1458189 RepID=UPI002FEE098A